MIGSNYIKNPLRSSAILNIQKDDNYCFIWSILAHLHPIPDPKNGHPTRGSNYRQSFNELNIDGFDFTNGFKCSDVHKFEGVNSLSINISELNFYQDQNEWKHNLIPIEFSEKKSDRVIDVIIYKNHCSH